MNDYLSRLEELLTFAIEEHSSDLHISVGHPPTLRINGRLVPLIKMKKLFADDTKGLAFALMDDIQKEKFLREKEIDFSYNFQDKNRFRVNVFFQNNGISCALRFVSSRIKSIEELNLPPALYELTQHTQGLVLITGPSNQGKSTTLAALVEEINNSRSEHIITIEDPIEYIFEDNRSIIDQREVYHDTLSFPRALKSTFRQDPNVIMVGEMRDSETIAITLTAAETGHLVFATLHTNSASQTVHRIIDNFSAEQQNQIRAQLAGSLLGVISQRLIPRIEGGLIPACEVMLITPAIRNLIRENKIHEIPLVIETNIEKGMMSLNYALARLVKNKEILLEDALKVSLDPKELKILISK